MRRTDLLSLAAALASPYRIVPPEQRAGGPAGAFGGVGSGQSVDFHDYREYLPGDDLRRVDWRAYARHGQMHLKLFREEVSPVVEMWLDTSASIGCYPGKEQTVLFAAAFLCRAVMTADGRPVLCRDGRRFSGAEFEPALADSVFTGGDGAEAPPSSRAARPVRFHFSDFLHGDGHERRLRLLAEGSLAFTPVLVLSQSERHPPWRGHRRLYDVEAPSLSLDVAVSDARVAAYRERLREHEDGLAAAARRFGARLVRLDAPDGDLAKRDCEAIVATLTRERLVTPR